MSSTLLPIQMVGTRLFSKKRLSHALLRLKSCCPRSNRSSTSSNISMLFCPARMFCAMRRAFMRSSRSAGLSSSLVHEIS